MDLMRSVYEGIILEIRRIVEAVPVYRKLDNVFVSGGFASGAAGQLLADILGRTIYIVSNSETALLGVAALGWRSLDTNAALPSLVRSTARSDSTTGVAPVDAEAYSGIFLEYRKLVDSLRYIYGRNSRPEAE
jgi:sugar (pentulose or hexulose) kinase